MKLSDGHCDLARTAKLLNYLPQVVSAHRTEGLSKVNEGPKEVAIILGFFPGAGVQRISCRQFHVLCGNHTGFLGGDTEQDV